jgi:hypothetical protein
LNAPEPPTTSENGIEQEQTVDTSEDPSHQVAGRGGPIPTGMAGYPQITPEQAMQYTNYLRNPGQQATGSYPMGPGAHIQPHGQ